MNKIVIFDWGGVIENHNDPNYGWHALTRNIIRRLSNDNSKEIKIWNTLTATGEDLDLIKKTIEEFLND